MSDDKYQIVVLGGGAVGKSNVVLRYLKEQFIDDYDPTIEESFRKPTTVDDRPCMLDIIDTAGQEEYSALRYQYLRSGHGFLIVYNIASKTSFNQIQEFRSELISVRSTTFPVVLCGNKCDLENERQISKEEGMVQAREWNCPFFECSALENIHITEIFMAIVREIRVAAPLTERSIERKKRKFPVRCKLL